MNHYYRPPTGQCWGCNLRKRVTLDGLIYNHTHATLHKPCSGGGQRAVEGSIRQSPDTFGVTHVVLDKPEREAFPTDGATIYPDPALVDEAEAAYVRTIEAGTFEERHPDAVTINNYVPPEPDWTWWDRHGWTFIVGIAFLGGVGVGGVVMQWWLQR